MTSSVIDHRVNIVEKADEEILALADPCGATSSNIRTKAHTESSQRISPSPSHLHGSNRGGHQFANSELARSLSLEFDSLGIIRRGEHVTVLYRQRSIRSQANGSAGLVLGYEDGKVRIFGASIF
jgi:hypothetical protein